VKAVIILLNDVDMVTAFLLWWSRCLFSWVFNWHYNNVLEFKMRFL